MKRQCYNKLARTLRDRGALFLILLTLLLPFSVRAEGSSGLPVNVCSGDFCGPDQANLWQRFLNAAGLPARNNQALLPGVYSGTCYYDSPMAPPDVPQYAVIFMDSLNGNIHFDGRFSFYKVENPFRRLTVSAAARRFPKRHRLIMDKGFARADASGPVQPFRYWMRLEEKTGSLMLVGYFGFRHTFLCGLDRHQPGNRRTD